MHLTLEKIEKRLELFPIYLDYRIARRIINSAILNDKIIKSYVKGFMWEDGSFDIYSFDVWLDINYHHLELAPETLYSFSRRLRDKHGPVGKMSVISTISSEDNKISFQDMFYDTQSYEYKNVSDEKDEDLANRYFVPAFNPPPDDKNIFDFEENYRQFKRAMGDDFEKWRKLPPPTYPNIVESETNSKRHE